MELAQLLREKRQRRGARLGTERVARLPRRVVPRQRVTIGRNRGSARTTCTDYNVVTSAVAVRTVPVQARFNLSRWQSTEIAI